MRADVYLVERGYAESRTRASRLILEGKIELDGKIISKPSSDISGRTIYRFKQQSRSILCIVISEKDIFHVLK